MPERYGRVRARSDGEVDGEADGEADRSLGKQLSLTLGRQFSGGGEVFPAEDSTPACLRRLRFQLRDVLLFVLALFPIMTLVRPPPIFAPYNGTCPDEADYHHWAAQMDGTETWLHGVWMNTDCAGSEWEGNHGICMIPPSSFPFFAPEN